MNWRYLWGSIIVIPILPILYFQGKRVKAGIPDLPEASGTEGLTKPPSGNFDGTVLKLLTIGESTIAGVGVATNEEGFSGTLAKTLAEGLEKTIHWKVYARSGVTAKVTRKEIVPTIDDQQADLIVIGLGGNDTFEGNSPAGWRRDARLLVESIREKFPKTPIIFTNLPPVREFPAFTPLMQWVFGNLVEILEDELPKGVATMSGVYCYSRRLTLEDWEKRLGVTGKPDDFFSDGVHPSKLTYQTLARDFGRFILQLGVV